MEDIKEKTMRARAYNTRQSFSVPQLRVIAAALVVVPEIVTAWTDAVLWSVMDWQNKAGLTGDGMIGPATLKGMYLGARVAESGAEPRELGFDLAQCARQFPGVIFGIDASVYQGKFEAEKIKAAGCRFVIHRASFNSGEDVVFADHLAASRGARMVNGGYHVPPNTKGTWDNYAMTDALKYARVAADISKRVRAEGEWGLGDWLDLEPDDSKKEKPPSRWSSLVDLVGRSKAALWVKTWLNEFENRTGFQAGVYFSKRLAHEGGDELCEVIGPRRTWWALYLPRPLWPRPWPPGLAKGYETGDIWQMRGGTKVGTAGGRCPGIDDGVEDCDLDVINPASPLAKMFGGTP